MFKGKSTPESLNYKCNVMNITQNIYPFSNIKISCPAVTNIIL